MEYNNSDNNKTKTDNSVKNFHTEPETNDVPLNEIQSIPTQLELVQQDNQFCKYCGTKIKSNFDYCTNCGRSTKDENITYCVKCGLILSGDTTFCPRCGKKTKSKSNCDSTRKIVNKKKRIIIVSIIVVLIVGIVGSVCFTVIPEILTTPYQIMEEGNYEKAYEKANNDEKEEVLCENLVAVCSETVKDNLKNPSSFNLQNVWFDKDEGKLVLKIGGTNSFGGMISNYSFFKYDKSSNSYEYYSSVDSLDKEEYKSYDDSDDLVEKLLDNVTKSEIKEIVQNDSLKITNGVSERINKLNQENLLDKVQLLNQVKLLYPENHD